MIVVSGFMVASDLASTLPVAWGQSSGSPQEVVEPLTGGVRLDSHDAGAALRVGRVDLLVYDIFRPDEIATEKGILAFLHRSMNALHVQSRHYVLRREILFETGDPYEPALLEETARNLRELGYLNNVSVAAVDTLSDGSVPILVQVQDTWSLKADFAYSLSSEGEQRWAVNLSEDNFFGHGLELGISLGQDEDFSFHQFFLQKRRLLGSRWQLRGSTARRGDGYDHRLELGRPFYALDDPWGLLVQGWQYVLDQRFYLNSAGLPGGGQPTRDGLHVLVPVSDEGFLLQGMVRTSSLRAGRVWRWGAGLEVREQDFGFDESLYELSDGRWVALDSLATPGTPVDREEGRTVYPHLAVSSEGRNWTTSNFLLQYGPVEDILLIPQFEFRVGYSGPRTGATSGHGDRILGQFEFQDWSRLGQGFLLLTGAGSFGYGQVTDRYYALDGVTGWVKLHGKGRTRRQTRLFGEVAWGENLLGTDAFVLGLNCGLRTLGFAGMVGDRLVRWNCEHGLILPKEILGFFRGGFAAFYDGGLAWWQGEEASWQDVHHEIGFGIRFGSTRSARGEIARVDLTWALDATGGPVLTAVTKGLF